MTLTRVHALCLCGFAIAACQPRTHNEGSDTEAVQEDGSWYSRRAATNGQSAASLDASAQSNYIDLRGVGDAGWADGGQRSRPLAAGIGNALRRVDPDKAILKGDLSFINFESVIGEECTSIRTSVDYYFLSHPDNVNQAFAHGFNLWGMANNHSQDCNSGKAFAGSQVKHGPLMTAEVMERKAGENALLWHGTGSNPWVARVREFNVKGRTLKVALGSMSVISWSIPNTAHVNFNSSSARAEARKLLESFKPNEASFADLRILSIHTQDASGHNRPEAGAVEFLKAVGEEFITKYGGNVVFGHGPHTWAGVRVIETGGRRGVIFTSLGNFIHGGLASNPDNYVARVLLDKNTLDVAQVQAIPFRNNGESVTWGGSATLRSNFDWVTASIRGGSSTVSARSASFSTAPVTPGKIECPQGYSIMAVGTAGGQICTDGTNVVGPFTKKMIEKCVAWGGGTHCHEDRWALSLAKSARGEGLCPDGASFDSRTTYCVEGADAFGPFPAALVEKCLAQNGGEACRKARWGRDFLAWLMGR